MKVIKSKKQRNVSDDLKAILKLYVVNGHVKVYEATSFKINGKMVLLPACKAEG